MRRLVVLAAALGLAAPAFAQSPLPFVLKEVGPGVYAAIDGPDHKAGSNAGFVIGDDGVLVVDAFFNQDAARALVSEIRQRQCLDPRFQLGRDPVTEQVDVIDPHPADDVPVSDDDRASVAQHLVSARMVGMIMRVDDIADWLEVSRRISETSARAAS